MKMNENKLIEIEIEIRWGIISQNSKYSTSKVFNFITKKENYENFH